MKKAIELDYNQLPLRIKIRGREESKVYILKSSARKLGACLITVENPLKELLAD